MDKLRFMNGSCDSIRQTAHLNVDLAKIAKALCLPESFEIIGLSVKDDEAKVTVRSPELWPHNWEWMTPEIRVVFGGWGYVE